MKSNPLIRSVIHQSFDHAVAQLGLPEFPRATFTQEIGQHLRAAGSLFEDDPRVIRKLWVAMLRGDILLTEQDQDRILFYVRAKLGGRMMDVRLSLKLQVWSVDAVVAMHRRPIFRTSGFAGTTTVAAVVVAGFLGFELNGPLAQQLSPVFPWLYHKSNTVVVAGIGQPTDIENSTSSSTNVPQSTATSTPPTGNSAASVNGGAVTGLSSTHSPSSGDSSSRSTSRNSKATSTPKGLSTTPSSSSTGAGEVSFTLKSGMPLHDLSVFLQQNQIIKESADAFDHAMTTSGVDRTVRPGTYTFKKGMTESQIFNILKHPQ